MNPRWTLLLLAIPALGCEVGGDGSVGRAQSALATPGLSDEIELSKPGGSAWTTTKRAPAVAQAIGANLTVWSQGPRDAASPPLGYGLRAVNSGAGFSFEPMTLTEAAAGEGDTHPAAAFDGTVTWVAWEHHDGAGADIQFSTWDGMGMDGFDQSPIKALSAPGDQRNPALACDDGGCFIAWQDGVDQGAIRAARIDGASLALEGSVQELAGAGATPALALGAGTYLVVWQDPTAQRIFGRRLDPLGKLLDAAPVELAPVAAAPALTADSSGFMLAWSDDGEIRLRRVHFDATLEEPMVIASGASTDGEAPAIASTGTYYHVVWRDGAEPERLLGLLVGSDGTPVGATTSVVGEHAVAGSAPVVLYAGLRTTVVFAADAAGASGVIEASFDHVDQTWDTPVDLAERAPVQQESSIAASAQGYLVSWLDAETDAHFLRAVRLDASANVLDAAPIEIASVPPGSANLVATASNGTDYAVLWRNYGSSEGLRLTRIRADGSVVDPNGTLIGDYSANALGLDSDGAGFLVLWGAFVNMYEITATYVDANGTVTNHVLEADAGWIQQSEAALAFDGAEHVAAWPVQDIQTYDQNLVIRRLQANGAPIPQSTQPLDAAEGYFQEPALTGGSGQTLAAWLRSSGFGGGPSELRVARIAAGGTVLDANGALLFGDDTHLAMTPTLTKTASGFLVLWTAVDSSTGVRSVMTARAPLGELPGPAAEIPELAEVEWLRVAAAGSDRVLITYERMVGDPGYGSRRVRARLLDPNGSASSEQDAGCSCALPGAGRLDPRASWLGLMAAALALGARRRTRR